MLRLGVPVEQRVVIGGRGEGVPTVSAEGVEGGGGEYKFKCKQTTDRNFNG
jgi:hypothetical protein